MVTTTNAVFSGRVLNPDAAAASGEFKTSRPPSSSSITSPTPAVLAGPWSHRRRRGARIQNRMSTKKRVFCRCYLGFLLAQDPIAFAVYLSHSTGNTCAKSSADGPRSALKNRKTPQWLKKTQELCPSIEALRQRHEERIISAISSLPSRTSPSFSISFGLPSTNVQKFQRLDSKALAWPSGRSGLSPISYSASGSHRHLSSEWVHRVYPECPGGLYPPL